MHGNWSNKSDDETLSSSTDFKPAHFHADLQLPTGDLQFLKDAALAIRQEYRECSRWKRLRCRKVSLFAERDRGTIVVVHVGSSVEFDWTWEGAVAFRPKSLDDNPAVSNLIYEDAAFEDEIVWKGEVIEVDERNGCLFISLDNPEAMPTTSSFFVRPFEFLSVLDSVYNESEFECVRDELPHRLAATQGGIHPVITTQTHLGQTHLGQRPLGLSQLQAWWQHSWSVLWGPPGTGKTWTTGQQIAAVLEDPTERILVVSTTNRATDAVALSIGLAVRERSLPELDEGRLLRIGKGASLHRFKQAGLESMLRGTESEVLIKIDELAGQLRLFDTWEERALTRKQITELKTNQSGKAKHNFVDPDVRVAVCTAFKAMSSLKQKHVNKMLRDGDAPFTTIFVDEAGLMSRTAIAALSLLAARRVVLVGDSKQLAPIR